MNPSIVGRWERTPVVLPILDQLDVIDEPTSTVEGLSQVQPEDLIPIIHEYVIGPGDIVTITIFELINPNQESVYTRRVNELGLIRLPIVGSLKVEGVTPSRLEQQIVDQLDTKGILKNATVSVLVQESRQNTYSVIGEPRLSGTAIGTYVIPKNDFRLMDAMALARGVSGSIKKIYVIRQISLAESTREVIPSGHETRRGTSNEATLAPVDLIEGLLEAEDDGEVRDREPGDDSSGVSATLDKSMEALLDQSDQWVYVNGKWVKMGSSESKSAPPKSSQVDESQSDEQEETDLLVTQRIVEVPYDKLLDGDMRYNIVIRPGDIIRVPPPVVGNVYIGGAISRPGTYALPGDRDLTFKQLVFAAGNLTGLAIPERVDLIRRVGNDQEATVRLNIRAIFDGTQPDFYLKPNDTINIGTSFAAVPLAVLRSGFRLSYGFGFLLDRNFGTDVFGPIDRDNN